MNARLDVKLQYPTLPKHGQFHTFARVVFVNWWKNDFALKFY
jgi:hypothetical protein